MPKSRAKTQAPRKATRLRNVPLAWFRHLPTPCFLLDADARVVYANDAFIELAAYREEEIIGARLDTLFDAKEIQGSLKSLIELYQGKALVRSEHDLLRKTGTRLHVVMDITPIYGKGAQRVTNAIGIVLSGKPV